MANNKPALLITLALAAQITLSSSLFTRDLTQPVVPQQCDNTFIKNLIPAGYPFETYRKTTDDGYILTMFRIQKKGTTITSGKPVIYLQHGLYNGGGAFFLNTEDQAAPFIFANAGFDVWVGNNRGSRYSRSHVSLSPTDKAFWDFSFDEMAKYDVPANIALIREITGVEKLTYIGHSMGTTQMFAALSDPAIRPKVAPFIHQYHALAPIVFMNQPQGGPPQELAALLFGQAKQVLATGVNYFKIGSCVFDKKTVEYLDTYCNANKLTCAKKYSIRWGISPTTAAKVDNWARFGYHAVVDKSGASTGNVIHLGQLVNAQIKTPGVFPKYDYGAAVNKKKYGTAQPPLYNLQLIKETIRLWVGTEDVVATIPEATNLVKAVSNADIKMTTIQGWDHDSFKLALQASTLYSKIIDVIKRG